MCLFRCGKYDQCERRQVEVEASSSCIHLSFPDLRTCLRKLAPLASVTYALFIHRDTAFDQFNYRVLQHGDKVLEQAVGASYMLA